MIDQPITDAFHLEAYTPELWLDTSNPDAPVLKERLDDEWRPALRQPVAMVYRSSGCDGKQCKALDGMRFPVGQHGLPPCPDVPGECRGVMEMVFDG